MRGILVPMLLCGIAAACAPQAQQGMAPVALTPPPAPAPPPVAVQPPPPVAVQPAPPPEAGLVGSLIFGLFPPPWTAAGPPTLLLNNVDFGPTHVEAVITANADCTARDAGYVGTQTFVLPKSGTRIIAAPPGADVCWRRDLDPDNPAPGKWTDWARAFLAPGRLVDSTL